MRFSHLTGRPYHPHDANCWSLARAAYIDNFGLEFPNFANPQGWWSSNFDYLKDCALKVGFQPIDLDPQMLEGGDLIMISRGSPVPNHLGFLLDNGMMLHHLVGDCSRVDPYLSGGYWRSQTTAVMRHPDVERARGRGIRTVDARSLLPDHVSARLVDPPADQIP